MADTLRRGDKDGDAAWDVEEFTRFHSLCLASKEVKTLIEPLALLLIASDCVCLRLIALGFRASKEVTTRSGMKTTDALRPRRTCTDSSSQRKSSPHML